MRPRRRVLTVRALLEFAAPLVVFAIVLLVALHLPRTNAAGPDAAPDPPPSRLADEHFSGCDAARAAGRENIPAWDPSYRPEMDGDRDGRACEPYRR